MKLDLKTGEIEGTPEEIAKFEIIRGGDSISTPQQERQRMSKRAKVEKFSRVLMELREYFANDISMTIKDVEENFRLTYYDAHFCVSHLKEKGEIEKIRCHNRRRVYGAVTTAVELLPLNK